MVKCKAITNFFIVAVLVFTAPFYGGDKKYKTTVEGPWDYITQSDLNDMGMENSDATMPFIRIGDNDYWIYLSEGGREMPMHSSVKRIRTTVSAIDKATAENVPIYGIPDAGINKYNGWKAWIMSLTEISANEWLAVTHYEDQDNLSGDTKEDFRMGIAYSDDDGKTFLHLGFVLETEIPKFIIKSGILAKKPNIAGGGFRRDDTYFYIYFADMGKQDMSDKRGAVARANAAEVIKNARKGKNTVWHKYYNGKWNEPGLGGRSSDVGSMPNHKTIMYNSYIKKWITFKTGGEGQNRNIVMRTTSDPLDFNSGSEDDEIIYQLSEGHTATYYSIMPAKADMTTSGREFYLYYRSSKKHRKQHFARLKISFE